MTTSSQDDLAREVQWLDSFRRRVGATVPSVVESEHATARPAGLGAEALPTVCILGDQAAGKTTLLSALVAPELAQHLTEMGASVLEVSTREGPFEAVVMRGAESQARESSSLIASVQASTQAELACALAERIRAGCDAGTTYAQATVHLRGPWRLGADEGATRFLLAERSYPGAVESPASELFRSDLEASAGWVICLVQAAWTRNDVAILAAMLRSPLRPSAVTIALAKADAFPDLSVVNLRVERLRRDLGEQLRQRGVDRDTAAKFAASVDIFPVCALAAVQRQVLAPVSSDPLAERQRLARFPTATADGTARLQAMVAQVCSPAAESARASRSLLGQYRELCQKLRTYINDSEAAEQAAEQQGLARVQLACQQLATELAGIVPPDFAPDLRAFEVAVERGLRTMGSIDTTPSTGRCGGVDDAPGNPSRSWSDDVVNELMRDEPAAAIGHTVRSVIEDAVNVVGEMYRAAASTVSRDRHVADADSSPLAAQREGWRVQLRESASECEMAAVASVSDAMKIVVEGALRQRGEADRIDLTHELRQLLAPSRFPVAKVAAVAIHHSVGPLDRLLQQARDRMVELVGSMLSVKSETSSRGDRVAPAKILLDELSAHEQSVWAAAQPFIEGRPLP